jgi:hypothetical protein
MLLLNKNVEAFYSPLPWRLCIIYAISIGIYVTFTHALCFYFYSDGAAGATGSTGSDEAAGASDRAAGASDGAAEASDEAAGSDGATGSAGAASSPLEGGMGALAPPYCVTK